MVSKYTGSISGHETGEHEVIHRLGTRDVIVQLYRNGPNGRNLVQATILVNSQDSIVVTLDPILGDSHVTDDYRVVVIG